MKHATVILAVVVMIFGFFSSTEAATSQYKAGVVSTDAPAKIPATGGGGRSLPPCSIQPGKVFVDGCPDEWFAMGIKPSIVDDFGDMKPSGLDILNVYITNDNSFLYILVEFAAPPVNASFLFINTDGNRHSGCGYRGAELGITFQPESTPEDSYIGDARDCGWGSMDFPGALKYVARGNFIEASVPLGVLMTFGSVQEIEIFCANDDCGSTRYALKTVPNPSVQPGGTLEGLEPFMMGHFVAMCTNLSTGQQVWGIIDSAHWNCGELGLSTSPGDLVFGGGAGLIPREEVPPGR